MKQFIKSLLDESTNISTQRFSLLICLSIMVILVSVFIILCFQKVDINYLKEVSYLIFGILGIGIGGKCLQKFGEREISNDFNSKPTIEQTEEK